MASNNPRVFMDIEAGGNALGRLVFELRDGKFRSRCLIILQEFSFFWVFQCHMQMSHGVTPVTVTCVTAKCESFGENLAWSYRRQMDRQ